jgi:3-oxoacyl-[acyl-carrier-protein] synthase III
LEIKKEELKMKAQRPVKIISSGKYLPKVKYSHEIELQHNLSSGWSERYSGVKSRHHVTFESNGYMGARAIEAALEKASMELCEIDLIIAAGATFDYPLPSQSSVIKSELKGGNETHIATIDIDSTCLSFVSAFEIAAKMLDGAQYKNIVIVSSEISSKGLNTKNPETLTLFGDGAAAFILTYDDEGSSEFIKGMLKTYSEGINHTIIRGGGNSYFFKDHPYNEKLHSFDMDGIRLLKLAKKRLPEFMNELFNDSQLSYSNIKLIIPHQASKISLYLFNKMFSFEYGIVKENIENHGNCIAASIPLLLNEVIEKNEIKRGDLCMLIGTSAGFSIGAVLFKY